MAKDEKKLKGIYKRGGVFWIRYAGVDGRMIFESARRGDIPGTRLKDAEDLLHERKAEVLKGKQPEVKRIPNVLFKDFADEYKKWMKGRHKSEYVKKCIIAKLVDRFGSVPLRRFNTPLVEQLQTELIEKGYKNAYVNKVLSLLKAMINKATEWEMVEEGVLKRVRRVKGLQEKGRLRYLSREECQALVAACAPHLRPIVITALNTGMRKGEILNLRRDNLDLANGFILLHTTKNGERREIAMNDTMRRVFQSIPRRLDTPYIFCDPKTGKPYRDVSHSFDRAAKAAGLEDLHFHDLRHTCASLLVMAGESLTAVKELLGHKDIKMTLRYAHLAPSYKKGTVEVLDGILGLDYTNTRQIRG